MPPGEDHCLDIGVGGQVQEKDLQRHAPEHSEPALRLLIAVLYMASLVGKNDQQCKGFSNLINKRNLMTFFYKQF